MKYLIKSHVMATGAMMPRPLIGYVHIAMGQLPLGHIASLLMGDKNNERV
jgi:hypothetical protein